MSRPASDPERLCADCGLCCDGTLFATVAVDPGRDREAIRALPLVETADGPRLPLPCPQLRGVRCGIYPDRPTRCRTFVCELHREVEDQRVSLDDAQAVVAETRALRDAVRPSLRGVAWWSALHRLEEAEPKQLSAERLVLRDRLSALRARVHKRFWQ